MNITVYCGSKCGTDPAFEANASAFGRLIGEHGHTLVFGASNVGLMAAVCEGAMAAGGDTIGVVPDIPFISRQAHPKLTKRIDTKDLAERKNVMMDLGDAYVALPGGLGTFDEIAVVMELSRLGDQTEPIVFMNVNGFYEDIKNQLEKMKQNGFLGEQEMGNVFFATSAEDAMTFIETKAVKGE